MCLLDLNLDRQSYYSTVTMTNHSTATILGGSTVSMQFTLYPGFGWSQQVQTQLKLIN